VATKRQPGRWYQLHTAFGGCVERCRRKLQCRGFESSWFGDERGRTTHGDFAAAVAGASQWRLLVKRSLPKGIPGETIAIETSTNLIQWTGVTTNILNGSGLYNFIEPNASDHPRRSTVVVMCREALAQVDSAGGVMERLLRFLRSKKTVFLIQKSAYIKPSIFVGIEQRRRVGIQISRCGFAPRSAHE